MNRALLVLPVLTLLACNGPDAEPTWDEAFDAAGAGAMSSVWGSGPDDVWVVGGEPGRGTAFHYDGAVWSEITDLPEVDLLVWVFGFGPADVWAVGVAGSVVHYDGTTWTELESGTEEDLWGVFGFGTDDLWMVGGDIDTGDPLTLHWDGGAFEQVAVAEEQNEVGARSLFKVWGIDGRIWTVGQRGLILELVDDAWVAQGAGPAADDDFVALWGTSTSNIVAVGGRSNARISTFDGTSWNTTVPSGVPGLSAVFMPDASTAVVGGIGGWAGTFDVASGEATGSVSATIHDLHAAWDDGAGHTYMVGGRFFDPYEGVALVQSTGE